MLDSYDLAAVIACLASYSSASDSDEPGKRAAVAAVLREGRVPRDTEILIVRRAERVSDPWSGHMALPGGRKDDGDTSLLDTAIRETREEVGIDLARHGTMLARLPDVPAVIRGKRMGLVIAPFVFAVRGEPEVTVNDEIAEALWVSLGPLARGEGVGTFPYNHEGVFYELPFFDVEGRRVWGLTFMMLQQFFQVLHR